MTSRTELPLRGIDGSNPLGFLAALGTFRTLFRVWIDRDVRLDWQNINGRWIPVLSFDHSASENDVVDAMQLLLAQMAKHAAFNFAENLNLQSNEFAAYAKEAARLARNKIEMVGAEFASAFACDAIINEDGTVQDTAFRTMSGAGHQHFLKFMVEIAKTTTPIQIHAALFDFWKYDEQKISLRWDPSDDRRYALRWNNPSGDVIRTVRGANRLAIEALPLFNVAPVGNHLETTGFGRPHEQGVFWTWPIWQAAISLDTCRSVLALPELQKTQPNRVLLSARGITDIFRCERITVGKFRNFTPAFSP
jgi:hypothetical protein